MSFSYNIVDSVTSFHWLFFRLALGKQFAGEKQSPQYGQDNVASWTKAPVAVIATYDKDEDNFVALGQEKWRKCPHEPDSFKKNILSSNCV